MAKKNIDIHRNSDGTITAIYGTDRISFTAEPWMSEAEIVERARWDLLALGVSVSEDAQAEVTEDL